MRIFESPTTENQSNIHQRLRRVMLGSGIALSGLIGLARHDVQDPNKSLFTIDENIVPVVDFESKIDTTDLGAITLTIGGVCLATSGIAKRRNSGN